MTREEVIKGLQEAVDWLSTETSLTVVDQWVVRDALALLKAQEPIEARLNLCESCTKEYPECDATIDGMEFDCGVGNDNIIGCTAYKNRWKAQEAMSPITSEVQYGDHLQHCPSCGSAFPNSGKYGKSNYCYKCGQAVKWE